jgi:hypothetical protein
MELALEAKGEELNQQQKLVKEKNSQMQSLHKNIRILNRTLADCSDVSLAHSALFSWLFSASVLHVCIQFGI